MRISGLATGMDTEKIIGDLMKAQRLPLDKITQKKQYMQWQMDDYRKTNRDLRATSDKVFDTVMKQSTFMAKNVNVSNDKAVSIKNINSTADFAGSIQVHQLATQSTLKSSGSITAVPVTNPVAEVAGSSTLESIGATADSMKITVKAPGATDAVTLTFAKTATIDDVINEVNKKTGVTAFFDSKTGKIAMTSKEGGAGAIEIKDVAGSEGLTGLLKLEGTEPNSSLEGQNSIFTFNGLQTQRSSNTFQLNGFEINLKQVTAPLGVGTVDNIVGGDRVVLPNGESITFSSAPDVDKVVDAVTQFVNDYNKMIEELNAKIREPKYRTFQPLSDEQKKDMKENEIKLWDEKAMSGTLRNDPEISSMLTKMRTLMSSTIEGSDGKLISLKDLGISTSTSYTEKGKLTINESKLRESIADNPNKAYEFFASPSKSADDVGGLKKGGLAVQFRAVVDETRGVISKKAGSTGSVNESFTMGRTMKDMNTQITKFEDRLKMVESRYWKQFNAMENAIQRANAQSASLMSALGGGA